MGGIGLLECKLIELTWVIMVISLPIRRPTCTGDAGEHGRRSSSICLHASRGHLTPCNHVACPAPAHLVVLVAAPRIHLALV